MVQPVNNKLDANVMIQDLLNEVNSVDPDMQRPHAKREDEERLVAKIDDPFLQKLYSLGMVYTKEVQRMQVDLGFESDEEQKKIMLVQARIAESRAKALFAVLWVLLREKYELWGFDGLGIRQGWEVCQCVEQQGPPEFLRKLFGGS